jgi:hypothetical protein
MLVNPALLPLFAVSLLWLALRRSRENVAWLKPAVLAVMMSLVVISPWMVRNRIAFGHWVFVRTNFGYEFSLSNYHGSHGRDWAGRAPVGNKQEMAAYIREGEYNYVKRKFAEGRQFVRDYPLEFVTLTLKRIPMFWDGSSIKHSYPAAPYWLPWSFPVFSLLFIPGLALACIRRVHGWPLYLWSILLYPFPYYIVHSQARFRQVLEPVMLLLIGYASVELFDKIRRRQMGASHSSPAVAESG